jgi:putative ABC transport system substrate-binding protein
MSYGPDFKAINRRIASMIDRILKGTKPADIPVEEPATFLLIINVKTAKAIGLNIPQAVLLRADELIE